MALGVSDVRDALDRTLASVEDAAVRLGVTLPARRYVTVGGAVYDCEQVSVSALSMTTGLVGGLANPMSDLGPCDPIWNMIVEIAVVRCAQERPDGPRGELPPRLEWVSADATAMSQDSSVLTEAVWAASADPLLAGEPQVNLAFTQPQGGLVAVVATVTYNPFRD